MASGIIGTISGVGTLTYTATRNAKVSVWALCTGASQQVTINNIPVAIAGGNVTYGETTHYVGAGQTLTVASTGATSYAVVTCLEENL